MAKSKEKCWEVRGCDPDMQEKCAFFESNAPCKISCYFTVCPGDRYELIADFAEHPQGEVDYEDYGMRKQQCASCKVFISYLKKVVK